MDGPFVAAAGNNEVVPTAAGNPVLLRAPSDGTYLLYFTNYRYYGKAMHTLARSLARSLSLSSPSTNIVTFIVLAVCPS